MNKRKLTMERKVGAMNLCHSNVQLAREEAKKMCWHCIRMLIVNLGSLIAWSKMFMGRMY